MSQTKTKQKTKSQLLNTCSVSVTTTVFEKTTTNFSPSLSLVGQKPFLTASPSTSLRGIGFPTMSSSTSSGPSLSKGGRGKKKPWAPSTSGSSSMLIGPEALAAYAASRESTPLPEASTSTARPRTPIFTRPAPPSLKRARRNTSSSLPTIPVEVLAGAHPNTSYFQHLFVKVALETGLGEFNPTPEVLIFYQMFRHLHDDYRKAIDGLTEDVSAVSE